MVDDGNGVCLSLAWDLASEGAAAPAASSAQKWSLGDAVAGMRAHQDRLNEAILDPGTGVTAAAVAVRRAYLDQCGAFLNGQRVTRGTLLDYARCARVFPPGHRMRVCGLSFSHARCISRCPFAEGRDAWISRALEEGLSVQRLQAAINAAMPTVKAVRAGTQPSKSVDEVGTQPVRVDREPTCPIARPRRSLSQHTLVCAATGRAITDLKAMVEVRLHLDAAEETLCGGTPRGAAARAGRNGAKVAHIRRLWFESRSALQSWLAARGAAAPDTGGRVIMAPGLRKLTAAKGANETL